MRHVMKTPPKGGATNAFRGVHDEDPSYSFDIGIGDGCICRHQRECMGFEIGKTAESY
jgi:hypothetical protein